MSSTPEPDQRQVATFWVGCAGAAAIALLGMFGPHDASVWRTPEVLERRVEAALVEAGFNGVDAEMRGQEATLHGVLIDQDQIAAATQAALSADGPGGPWAGAVTAVDAADLKIGPVRTPYAWRVRRNDQEVVLSGVVQSEHARHELMRAAMIAFPNADPPIDEMELAAGAPAPHWLDVAKDAIAQLAKLSARDLEGEVRTGEARIVDDRIVFIGEALPEAEQAVRAHYERAPAPFSARIDIALAGEDGVLQNLGDAQSCEFAFTQLMAHNIINFETGSAGFDQTSRALLDQIASVALRCDAFSIEVAGHTDNQGGRDINMDLSQRRAQSVVDYLTRQGVAAERLNAVGYGPDQPVASNVTLQGQAANRRIEFDVSG